MVVYILPLYLYTKSTPSFIYFVVRVVIEEKEKKHETNKNSEALA